MEFPVTRNQTLSSTLFWFRWVYPLLLNLTYRLFIVCRHVSRCYFSLELTRQTFSVLPMIYDRKWKNGRNATIWNVFLLPAIKVIHLLEVMQVLQRKCIPVWTYIERKGFTVVIEPLHIFNEQSLWKWNTCTTIESKAYYPPEVSSMKYCCLGVFRNDIYFRLVTN